MPFLNTQLRLHITLWFVVLNGMLAWSSSTYANTTTASSEHASDCSSPVREGDEVWLMSSRHLGCAFGQHTPSVRMKQYGQNAWHVRQLEEFLAGQAEREMLTVFFLHGNRTNYYYAQKRGWMVYRNIIQQTPDAPPVRFVIWAWPADKVRGQVRDFRAKASRSDSDAYYLSWLVSQMNPDSRISMIGYSFGARIILGALHLIGGGDLCGQTLSLQEAPRTPVRVVLMAAATHDDWLIPGRRHGEAYAQIDRMLLLNNSCDVALRWYRFLDRCTRPDAMGYWGVAGRSRLADQGQRIVELDAGNVVGRKHSIDRYFGSTRLIQQMRQYTLWESDELVSEESDPSPAH